MAEGNQDVDFGADYVSTDGHDGPQRAGCKTTTSASESAQTPSVAVHPLARDLQRDVTIFIQNSIYHMHQSDRRG